MKSKASKQQLYALLWDLPKGGDMHNHFGLSNVPEQWYTAATNKKRTDGNEFFTRTRFNNRPDSVEPFLRFRNIQRSTYLKLPDCRKDEYQSLAALSQDLKAEWLSALIIDKDAEGRNEFFDVIVPRVGELARDPWLATDLLVENMRRYAAQGLRSPETQMVITNYQDR
ncbi:MAG: adenosine deaminase, partial [Bryobacteraceae bacterium]